VRSRPAPRRWTKSTPCCWAATTTDDDLRGTIGRLRGRHLASACAVLSPDGTDGTDGTALALISLGRRWLTLHQEVATLDREIRKRVKAIAPRLLAKHGVGIHTAAQLLITAADNPDRLTHDAAFAALCGTSPVDASSGKTHRHRLNRGGDRSANTALWIIAPVRLVHDPGTRAYAARRTTLGDSRKDILRRLQRYISRELYPIITASLAPTTTANPWHRGINAVIESFWGRVQTELLNRRRWRHGSNWPTPLRIPWDLPQPAPPTQLPGHAHTHRTRDAPGHHDRVNPACRLRQTRGTSASTEPRAVQ
jgi:hypothetical protein